MPATRTGRRVPPPSIDPLPSPSTHLFNSDVPSPSVSLPSPNLASPSSSTVHTPLFPASSTPAPRRPSHHKKRPPTHIPRPPNAFILFRANFIHDRHLHTSATGPLSNVSPTALSTIVGITWKNLPDEERQIWVEKARVAREEHKRRYPSYRYQPLPTAEERAASRENKRKVKEENIPKPDVERCQEISRLLVQGHRGQELENLVAKFDSNRESPATPTAPGSSASHIAANHLVRSSSLPTPVRRRSSKRSRAYSASASPELESPIPYVAEPQPHAFLYDSRVTPSPELQAEVGQYNEHAMPDLTYDAPSPSSINLPEPLEGGYIPSMPHGTIPSQHYPHLPISQRDNSQSFVQSLPLSASSNTNDYPSTFSALTSWDNTRPITQPQPQPSYQFSYFTPANDNVMIPDTHLPQEMLAQPYINNDHPYASSIPPFELYHTLKPFEQACDAFPSTLSPPFHAIDNDLFYDHA